jgi:hypothetical protein
MNRKEFIHSTMSMLAEMGYTYLEFGGTSIAEMQGNEKACAQSSIDYLKTLKF